MKNNTILFLLTLNPWPIFISFSLLFLSINLVSRFNSNFNLFAYLNFFLILLIIFSWWIDIIIESTLIGFHNKYIIIIIIYSIIIFLISEVFFFIRFFWTYFHSIFSPDIFIGLIWPSIGIISIRYLNLPILNSLLLIRSGCSITYRHFKILAKKINSSYISLILTILLGILFIFCQYFEYNIRRFTFSDRIFGSIFFISTGFHGIHVIIGTLFLTFILFRIKIFQFSSNHLLGLEFSIWYWHFVDVVWLYLYIIIYWLGI